MVSATITVRQLHHKRDLHRSPGLSDTDKPTHASVDDHVIPYPEDHERDPTDVGHSTTGGKVGPHTKRTLATFSMVSGSSRLLLGDGFLTHTLTPFC